MASGAIPDRDSASVVLLSAPFKHSAVEYPVDVLTLAFQGSSEGALAKEETCGLVGQLGAWLAGLIGGCMNVGR